MNGRIIIIIVTFIECFQHSRNYAKCFTCMGYNNCCYSHVINTMMLVLNSPEDMVWLLATENLGLFETQISRF